MNCAVVFTYSESDNSLDAECLFVSTMCYILGATERQILAFFVNKRMWKVACVCFVAMCMDNLAALLKDKKGRS